MADTEIDSSSSTKQRTSIGLNLSFIKTPAGLCMLVNMVMLFLAWCIMAGWRNSTLLFYSHYYNGETSFFLFATVTPWLIILLLFVALLFQLHTKLAMINWPLTFFINCIIWAILLIIASSIIANKSTGILTTDPTFKDGHLKAAAAFGFISMFGLLVEAAFHLREFL